MEITLKKFQKAAKERRVAPGHRPAPYSVEQREFVVAFARKELETGSSKSAILRTLGISEATLTTWLASDEAAASSGFRRVQLETELESDCLSLVTPGGPSD